MLDREKIPAHIAIIMDGNGRWAKAKGVPRVAGHNAGMQAMKEIVKASSQLGVKHLTVYAFYFPCVGFFYFIWIVFQPLNNRRT